jgi:hypothetical protein
MLWRPPRVTAIREEREVPQPRQCGCRATVRRRPVARGIASRSRRNASSRVDHSWAPRILAGMRTSLVTPALAALAASATLVVVGIAGAAPSDTLHGSGKAASAVRTVAAFRAIELDGSIDLEFRAGAAQRVEIVADDNLLPYVTTTVKDGSLRIATANRSMSTRTEMRAIVTAPELGALAIRGSGDAKVSGLSGKSFALSVRGSGEVDVAGRTDAVAVKVSGSGDVDAKELVARSAAIDVDGSGDVEVHATQVVAININGAGEVDVYGKPKSVVRKVNGSGSIEVH